MSAASDLQARITDSLIAAIEAGGTSWSKPWQSLAAGHVNVDGRPYRGVNVIWLALIAAERGWDAPVWGTYRAWQAKGCQVRKGSRATPVLLWRPQVLDELDEHGKPRTVLLARTYNVFAAAQVDGSDAVVAKHVAARPEHDSPEAIAAADAWFGRVGADIRHGGDRAFYSPGLDRIQLPTLAQFRTAAHYYATRAHETVHWTAHQSRLDRDLTGRFGSDAYAGEELVAELGAAMWCGLAGLSAVTRDDHVGYLAGWLRILRADPKHLVTVASRAQAAVDFLAGLAGDIAPVLEEQHA